MEKKEVKTMSIQDIYNYRKVNERIITGGQPTAEQLKAAADEGYQTVINLATYKQGESLENEAILVHALGMVYYPIPVEWDHPRISDFISFEQVMTSAKATKILLHCAANYRATAFYSLYAMKYEAWTQVQAEQFRSSVWAVNKYPIWEKFIRQVEELLQQESSQEA